MAKRWNGFGSRKIEIRSGWLVAFSFMAAKKQRISTGGGAELSGANPFASLQIPPGIQGRPGPNLPARSPGTGSPGPAQAPPGLSGKGTRLEIRRLKGGKGGKTVTEIRGFDACHRHRLPDLAKELKARFGVGGAVKLDIIEIQGDQRDAVAAILRDRGFRPVLAGG